MLYAPIKDLDLNADPIEVAARVLGPLAGRDEPLGPRTTYRVGGAAALFVEVESDDDLAQVAEARAKSGLAVLVLGRGSNLLVADAGFPGITVSLGEAFQAITFSGATVTAGGATSLPVLARRTAAVGWRGLEWAVGVPGSVGGAVRMNAGGHGSDTAATLVSAVVFDLDTGALRVMPVDELTFGYRSSAVGAQQVVLSATFALTAGEADEAEREIDEIVRWRRENQPGGQNAGSVFANPPGDSAGRLIDIAGCKELRIGSAQVSAKHANFIQADVGGSADDVFRVMTEVRRRVAARTGVILQPEVRLVGYQGFDELVVEGGSPR